MGGFNLKMGYEEEDNSGPLGVIVSSLCHREKLTVINCTGGIIAGPACRFNDWAKSKGWVM